MKKFKITNLKSKVVQYMNESEKKQFFTKNSLGNYKWENLKAIRNKKIENIAFTVFTMAAFSILIILMCGTFSLIDSLIF